MDMAQAHSSQDQLKDNMKYEEVGERRVLLNLMAAIAL